MPVKNLGEQLYVNASCGGLSSYKCPSGKGDSNGYAAVVYLYAADLTLSQASQPTVSDVEGELATAPTLSGSVDLSFHAADSGSGVYEAVFTVNGVLAGHTLLDENGGRCRDVGQTSDGLPAFLYLQPCPASLSVNVPLDTTTLTNGTHHLVVSVTNAAGNSTVVLDRKVTVSNDPQAQSPPQSAGGGDGETTTGSSPPQSGGSGGGGSTNNESSGSSSPQSAGGGGVETPENDPYPSPPTPASQLTSDNGTNASAGATLRVRWATTAHTALAGAYGHSQTVVGQLTAPSGAPIAGALLRVLDTPDHEGARTVSLVGARTAPDGSLRVRLPAGLPSSRLTFAYASNPADVVPDVTAALTLTVPASLSLNITPRDSHAGGTIVFSGTLHGTPLPPGGKQLVLEARAPGASWRQFQTLATHAHGRYRASYRFRLAGPITYEFRAVCPAEADFPYGTGASHVVRVHER